MKRSWLDLAVTLCLGIAISLVSIHVQRQQEAIDAMRDELHEESDRADEAESRLSWRVREIEQTCRSAP